MMFHPAGYSCWVSGGLSFGHSARLVLHKASIVMDSPLRNDDIRDDMSNIMILMIDSDVDSALNLAAEVFVQDWRIQIAEESCFGDYQ